MSTQEEPPANAARKNRLLIAAAMALAFFVGGPLLPRIGLPPLSGFGLSVVGGIMSLIVAPWSALAWRKRRGKALTVATLLSSIPALAFIVVILGSRGFPSINDVSTDLSDPPAFVVSNTEYPSDFVAQVEAHYGDLETLVTPEAPEEAFEHALRVATSLGWVIVERDESERFQATETSALFQFVDDVVVRVRSFQIRGAPDQPTRRYTLIDVRSRSRTGRGDVGANAARIRRFLKAYPKESAR